MVMADQFRALDWLVIERDGAFGGVDFFHHTGSFVTVPWPDLPPSFFISIPFMSMPFCMSISFIWAGR
jgi:hypothetical protein